jgi:O-antigen/teichoic acid export membrane protein
MQLVRNRIEIVSALLTVLGCVAAIPRMGALGAVASVIFSDVVAGLCAIFVLRLALRNSAAHIDRKQAGPVS